MVKPSMAPSGGAGSVADLVRRRTGDVGRAMLRGVWEWPGIDACVVAYAVAAAGLYAHSTHPQLWGLVASMVVGVGWYITPARTWEVRRRQTKMGKS